MEEEILTREMEVFNEHKEKLLKEHNGKYVLIKDDKIIDTFQSQVDALKEGYKRYKKEPFLVKQIIPFDSPINFTSNMIG